MEVDTQVKCVGGVGCVQCGVLGMGPVVTRNTDSLRCSLRAPLHRLSFVHSHPPPHPPPTPHAEAVVSTGAGAPPGHLSAFTDAGLPFRSSKVVTQCVVQLELIATVAVLAEAHLGALSTDNIVALIGVLQDSSAFAQSFNANR
jgi:hypothetical protein